MCSASIRSLRCLASWIILTSVTTTMISLHFLCFSSFLPNWDGTGNCWHYCIYIVHSNPLSRQKYLSISTHEMSRRNITESQLDCPLFHVFFLKFIKFIYRQLHLYCCWYCCLEQNHRCHTSFQEIWFSSIFASRTWPLCGCCAQRCKVHCCLVALVAYLLRASRDVEGFYGSLALAWCS